MPSRLLVLVVFAALFLAVPTMAATVAEDRAGDLSLTPSESSNGEYAQIDADGQLSVEMNRLNDRATTTTDDVFTITNTDDEDARVWVEHDLAGTTIYRGDPSNPVESRGAAFELDAGETASLGVRTDTRDADVEPGDITIRAEGDAAPDFAVTDVQFEGLDANGSVAVGETVRITATVANRGGASGSHSADLVVDGVEVAQRAVYVPAGERQTVTFDRTFERPGEYEVGVDHTSGGTITVREPPAPDAASFEVRNAALASGSIAPGESVDVTATVANTGGSTGEFTAELAVGGTVLETRTVRLGPGETTAVTFTRAFDRPGVYEIAVSGASAGELDVSSPGGGAEAVEQQLRSPATGVVGLSFVAGALLVSRRNPRELLALLR